MTRRSRSWTEPEVDNRQVRMSRDADGEIVYKVHRKQGQPEPQGWEAKSHGEDGRVTYWFWVVPFMVVACVVAGLLTGVV